jgi:hypothetical protein
MSADQLLNPARKGQPASGLVDWLTVLFTLLALAAGVIIALVVGQFGALALLAVAAIPVVVIMFLQPDLGLVIFVFITYTNLSNVLIRFFGLPSIAQPMVALLVLVILVRHFVYGVVK